MFYGNLQKRTYVYRGAVMRRGDSALRPRRLVAARGRSRVPVAVEHMAYQSYQLYCIVWLVSHVSAEATIVNAKGHTEYTCIGSKKQMWYGALVDFWSGFDDERRCDLMFKPERYNIFIDNRTVRGEL